MKIKPPKAFGKLRYVQYTDIAGELRHQQKAVLWVLLVLVFCAVIDGLLIAHCITGRGAWDDWLLAAFMTFGTVLGFRAYLPMLTRVQVGLVCDRGVGYAWLRRDGSVAREQWYAFKPETNVNEWKRREGRTWNMQDQYLMAFCEGHKKCFLASYLVRYEDDTNLEFMHRATGAFLAWKYRHNREHCQQAPDTGADQ